MLLAIKAPKLAHIPDLDLLVVASTLLHTSVQVDWLAYSLKLWMTGLSILVSNVSSSYCERFLTVLALATATWNQLLLCSIMMPSLLETQ